MQTYHNILFTAEKYQNIQKNIPPTAKIESSIPNPLGLPSFFLPCPGILGLARQVIVYNMLQGKQDIIIFEESCFLFFLWFQTIFFLSLQQTISAKAMHEPLEASTSNHQEKIHQKIWKKSLVQIWHQQTTLCDLHRTGESLLEVFFEMVLEIIQNNSE